MRGHVAEAPYSLTGHFSRPRESDEELVNSSGPHGGRFSNRRCLLAAVDGELARLASAVIWVFNADRRYLLARNISKSCFHFSNRVRMFTEERHAPVRWPVCAPLNYSTAERP